MENKKEDTVTINIKDCLDSFYKIAMILCLAFLGHNVQQLTAVIEGKELSQPTNQTQIAENNTQSQEEADLYTDAVLYSDYGNSHRLDASALSMSDLFELEEEEYFVFFYMDSCTYCHQAMPALLEYIERGMTDSVPLYFIEISGEEKYWSIDGEETPVTPQDFVIVGTPTLLHVNQGAYEAVVGPSSIATMLGVAN